MSNMLVSEWRKLPVTLAELCIETTLRCGQSFRWKKLRDDEWYVLLLKSRIQGFDDFQDLRPSWTDFVS